MADAASRPPGQSRSEGQAHTPYVTSAVGIEETAGRQRARRLTLFTRTVIWVTGLVCAAFLLGSLVQAWSNSQLMQSLQRQQQMTQQLQNQHTKLQQQASHYQDPYEIESEARQQLGYARPGEHVVVVANASSQSQPRNSSTPKKSAPQNFWQAWWDLFFGNG
ncbi:MAG TPA: septum formation initiator family protein [Ktedonobacteraceae bacterium]|nr:septum formation initiator family protein [Ktedonobacteraceae bacterium]